MAARPDIHDPIALKAAEWMLELQRPEVDEQRLIQWQTWLAADARHRQAFDRLQRVQECIDAIDDLPWPSDTEVSAQTTAFRAPRMILALAATLAAVAIGTGLTAYLKRTPRPDAGAVIATSIGELRRVPLDDGSTLTAGGRSQLTVNFMPERREIRLEKGEAFFEVAKDAVRPFVVYAGDTAITALGTAFNVRRTDDQVVVAVAQGLVETRGPGGVARLAAGRQIRIGAHVAPTTVDMPPEGVAAWRDGQREYRAEPLSEVVADLARYSARRIVIEDDSIGRMAVTGTVFERDIDRWLSGLSIALPVEVRTDADGVVRIGPRHFN